MAARRPSAGVTASTRSTVIARDSPLGFPQCQWCGRTVSISSGDYSLQHRRARGMGGTKRPDANAPQNLVLVCGSATTGCHGYIESHRADAIARGFNVSQHADPLRIPVIDRAGRSWWLTADGHRTNNDPDT